MAWSDAADYAIEEARATRDVRQAALCEAEALIAGAGYPLLARPFTSGLPRERRVCYLRYLLPEGSFCPGICPKAPRITLP